MNVLDQVKNGVEVIVSTGYGASASSIILASSEGIKLPDPASGNFNLIWYNSTDYKRPFDDPNVEIVRVTAKSTDTLTVTRPASGNNYNGEGSGNTAKTHNTADKIYKMILGLTKKTIEDIDTKLGTVLTKSKSANQDVLNSSTLINDTHLFFNASSNTVYNIHYALNFFELTGSNGAVKLSISAPTDSSVDAMAYIPSFDTAYNPNPVFGINFNSGNNFILANTSVGNAGQANLSIILYVRVAVGSTAGTINLRWAQNTADATGTTRLRIGSYLIAIKE